MKMGKRAQIFYEALLSLAIIDFKLIVISSLINHSQITKKNDLLVFLIKNNLFIQFIIRVINWLAINNQILIAHFGFKHGPQQFGFGRDSKTPIGIGKVSGAAWKARGGQAGKWGRKTFGF